jgi:LemA protein
VKNKKIRKIVLLVLGVLLWPLTLALGIGFGIYGIIVYNELVTLRNSVKFSWAQIEALLQRRYDLIPNLVDVVKGYASHENEVLINVTKARTGLMNAVSVSDKADANNVLSMALKSLYIVAEKYPELKANESFRGISKELINTENGIASSRQNYNSSVLLYNTATEIFPKNLVAKHFKFVTSDYFGCKPGAVEPTSTKIQ